MELARTSSREAASALQTRIRANLSSVSALAAAMAATKSAGLPLQRPQIDEMTKATLMSSEDFIGSAVTWEPNALDGKDADFAGKKPLYDDTGRHMPYWTRKPGGGFNVEAIVFDPRRVPMTGTTCPRGPTWSSSPNPLTTPSTASRC